MTENNSNMTAGTVEMEANQRAYNESNEDNDIIIVSENGETRNEIVDAKGEPIDIEQKNIPANAKQTMIRTDVDVNHKEYQAHDLQQHNSGSTLDITSYNVYNGTGTNQTKPSEVVVGVAGSTGYNEGPLAKGHQGPDWALNYTKTPLLDSQSSESYDDVYASERRKCEHSVRNGLTGKYGSEEQIQQAINAQMKDNTVVRRAHQKVESNRMAEALRKPYNEGVPITIVGDSKGAEDAAYIAVCAK